MAHKKLQRPIQHYDMVEVIWDDAAGFRDGWKDKTDPIEPQLALSVGFLLVDTNDHIILASDTDERGAHNGRTQIPRGMVKRIRILRKKDKEKNNGTNPTKNATPPDNNDGSVVH